MTRNRMYTAAELVLAAALVASLATACSRPRDPVADLIRDLDRYPEYSLVVDDLRVEDGFFPDYFLRFEVMTASGQRASGGDDLAYERRQSDWMQVPERVFARYEHYLGMVVSAKTPDGRRTGASQAHPPGYQYVGNSSYGSWGAGGFWQFYGQYAFMSSMLGGHGINRADYNDYRRTGQRGRPYFGPTKDGKTTFGTRGTATQAARPSFYRRYQQRLSSGGRGFASRSTSRMGRSTSSRSRFGK
ncbi:hypothetical protein ACFL6X_00995 [Candidatus Latescibacterota bacterium]